MYDTAVMHSEYALDSCLENAYSQTPVQTGQLPLPVHDEASTFFIQPVEWAEQVCTIRFCHMKINESGFNTLMTQELFDAYDIHPELKQMSSIAVTESVKSYPFLQATLFYRFPQGPLHSTNA